MIYVDEMVANRRWLQRMLGHMVITKTSLHNEDHCD